MNVEKTILIRPTIVTKASQESEINLGEKIERMVLSRDIGINLKTRRIGGRRSEIDYRERNAGDIVGFIADPINTKRVLLHSMEKTASYPKPAQFFPSIRIPVASCTPTQFLLFACRSLRSGPHT